MAVVVVMVEEAEELGLGEEIETGIPAAGSTMAASGDHSGVTLVGDETMVEEVVVEVDTLTSGTETGVAEWEDRMGTTNDTRTRTIGCSRANREPRSTRNWRFHMR